MMMYLYGMYGYRMMSAEAVVVYGNTRLYSHPKERED